MAKSAKSFEESMARLEEVVRVLEAGELSLDESLKLYEEGIGLVRLLNEKLDSAEQKIRLLSMNPDGSMTEKEFGEKND